MTDHRRLRDPLTAYRIGDPEGMFPIWSDGGAKLVAGRWHMAGDPVIYAAEHYSTAMLEKLAHFGGDTPDNQHYIEITLPAGTSYEVFADHQAPGWRAQDSAEAMQFGHAWVTEGRSCILMVPSVVAPIERNIIFNTQHTDFAKVSTGLETPIWWDDRLL